MAASGLNPVIIKQNTIKIVAIEFREAKKPLVVENRPIRARAKSGKLTSGDKKTLSKLLCHEKIGAKPVMIFPRKSPIWKSFANKSSIIVSG